MNPGDPRGPAGAARRHATVLESVEEVRAQVRGAMTVKEAALAPGQAADARPFRPTQRPPMGLLCVLDDGDDSGETVRVRATPFVIGRVDGSLIIPHDSGMSGRHAEIGRRFGNGEHSWYLRDLQSTNGTFVRAASVVLSAGQELLIGGRRFRFEDAAPPHEPEPAPVAGATRKWEALSGARLAAAAPPALVDVSPGHEGRRLALTAPEHWLGRDPGLCSLVVDDPMVDRKHARIARDGRNRWVITNARSLNGLWARVQEVGLGGGGFFQCGEQRFLFKPL